MGKFLTVAASLPPSVPAMGTVGAYRLRWQAEPYFKRLKSTVDFANFPAQKKLKATCENRIDTMNCKSQMQAKLECIQKPVYNFASA